MAQQKNIIIILQEIGDRVVNEIDRLDKQREELDNTRNSENVSYKKGMDAKKAIDAINQRMNEIYDRTIAQVTRQLKQEDVTPEQIEILKEIFVTDARNFAREFNMSNQELEGRDKEPQQSSNPIISKMIEDKEVYLEKNKDSEKIMALCKEEQEYNELVSRINQGLSIDGEEFDSVKDAKIKIKELNKQSKELEKEIEKIKAEIEQLEKEVEESNKEKESLERERDLCESQLSSLKLKSEDELSEDEKKEKSYLEEKISNINGKISKIDDKKMQLDSKKSELATKETEKRFIDDKISIANKEIEEYKEKPKVKKLNKSEEKRLEELENSRVERLNIISDYLGLNRDDMTLDDVFQSIEREEQSILINNQEIDYLKNEIDAHFKNQETIRDEASKILRSSNAIYTILNDRSNSIEGKEQTNDESEREPQQTGPQQTGPQQTGPQQTGQQQTGPQQTGPQQTGPQQTGPQQTGPQQTGQQQTGPQQTGQQQTEQNSNLPVKQKKPNIFKRFGDWIKAKTSLEKKMEKQINKDRKFDYSKEMVAKDMGILPEEVTDKQIKQYEKMHKKEIKAMQKSGEIANTTNEAILNNEGSEVGRGESWADSLKNWPPDPPKSEPKTVEPEMVKPEKDNDREDI